MNDVQMRLVKPEGPLRVPHTKRPLGRLLVDRGLIKTSDLLATLGHQRFSDVQLGHLLISRGLITQTQLFQTLAEQYRVPYIDPAVFPADPSLLKGIEPHQALRTQSVPWARVGGVTLVATSAPEHFEDVATELPAHLHPITMAVANKSDIEAMVCFERNDALAMRAELLVPDALSCRQLPRQIKILLGVFVPTLCLALLLQWLTLESLYRSIFMFAVAMIFLGMAIKIAGAVIHLISKAPILKSRPELPERLPSVSILIPLHDESSILSALLKRIELLSYPKTLLDVILIVEAGDTRTRDHLDASRLPVWMRVLVVPPGKITTKPRALNYALPFCQGEIVGIYDAEDAPHPEQISQVVANFAVQPERVACIQAVLDFYNARANALSKFFAIEYATWFRLILPGIARLGFAIPLGGTSVFFRRNVLEKLHGWDAHNVTEDADLGIRLARAGYSTMLINSVTLEEANNSVWPWIKQRSRWLKGYLITYFTHMRRPLRLLFELGAWKFFGFQAFFLSSISQYMLAPLIWSCMLLYLGAPHWMQSTMPPEIVTKLMFIFIVMWFASTTIYIIAVSGKEHRHLIPWTLLMSAYMALGTLAIYKGAWELITRPFYWEKTAHGHSADTQSQDVSVEDASSLSRVTNATEM